MSKFLLFKICLLLIMITSITFSPTNSYTVEPEEILKDKQQELRARNISKKIRCMVCQNQSIDDSNAPLAKDLRILIRKKIKEGSSDESIIKFLTDRYGDFILLKPPFNSKTLILWIFPFIFLIFGIYILFYHNKKSIKNLKRF